MNLFHLTNGFLLSPLWKLLFHQPTPVTFSCPPCSGLWEERSIHHLQLQRWAQGSLSASATPEQRGYLEEGAGKPVSVAQTNPGLFSQCANRETAINAKGGVALMMRTPVPREMASALFGTSHCRGSSATNCFSIKAKQLCL